MGELRKAWAEEDRLHMIHGGVPLDQFAAQGTDLILESASGIRVRDITGREYIDGLSGAICVNIGYSRPELAQAARDQMLRLSYAGSWSGVTSTAAIEYCRDLAWFLPQDVERTMLVNSGAEAAEAAFKMARYYWANQGRESKIKIISRDLAYHGLDMGSTWATGLPRFQQKIGPPLPDFLRIPACYCYRCPLGRDYPGCDLECAAALAETIEREGPQTVAAFVAEPIYGVSGTIIPPPEYFPKIREICHRFEVLLILDEVMTGFGRTGRNFCCQHWGVTPDLMCLSKGMISSHLPIAGTAFTEKVFQGMLNPGPFPHLHTTGAHPVACAVASKNLEILIAERLVENSAEMGAYMLQKLEALSDHPHVGQVQGLGLFLGFEVVKDKKTRETFSDGAEKKLAKKIKENGVIVRPGGSRIQIGPPLIVTAADVDQICGAVESALADFEG